MKKLIAFCVLSLITASASAAECPVNKTCDFKIGPNIGGNNPKTIWFVGFQPGNHYVCQFRTVPGMSLEIRHFRPTAGVSLKNDYDFLPANLAVDTTAVLPGHEASFAVEFNSHNPLYRYDFAVHCAPKN